MYNVLQYLQSQIPLQHLDAVIAIVVTSATNRFRTCANLEKFTKNCFDRSMYI